MTSVILVLNINYLVQEEIVMIAKSYVLINCQERVIISRILKVVV